jgi:pectate lyase
MEKSLWATACGNADNVRPENIQINEVLGLNEQIYLSLGKPAGGEYVVSYKADGAEAYTAVDKELLLDEEGSIGCYILGLKEGVYSVRVECGEGEAFSRVTLNGIGVERQDRSGYAHFRYDEGIGGYNNDGTVKENARIVYVSNATKNTVTLEINGTTYTGLVEILQAKAQMEEPLIIRILDTITTNQWNSPDSERQVDYSAMSAEYIEKNHFSDEYGENLAGLYLHITDPSDNRRYIYKTTPDGVTELTEEIPIYNESNTNFIDTVNACHITLEGVGRNAGLFQFGVGFIYCNSVEVRNLTLDRHPFAGIAFYASGASKQSDCYGRLWIHGNTFRPSYNAWNDRIGDKSIIIIGVHDCTVAYNRFDQTNLTFIMGGWEYDYQLNTTVHHNYYHEVIQRMPLSRNANIHNYNNYYDTCGMGLSPRTATYVFSEENYFKNVKEPTYISSKETWGVIKSFHEIYDGCGDAYRVFPVRSREEAVDTVEYTCFPDKKTDYSRFDTDPALFYYDAENKRSDVEILHDVQQVPDVVPVYAGAGVLTKLELDS